MLTFSWELTLHHYTGANERCLPRAAGPPSCFHLSFFLRWLKVKPLVTGEPKPHCAPQDAVSQHSIHWHFSRPLCLRELACSNQWLAVCVSGARAEWGKMWSKSLLFLENYRASPGRIFVSLFSVLNHTHATHCLHACPSVVFPNIFYIMAHRENCLEFWRRPAWELQPP